jgi:hypothetical protein
MLTAARFIGRTMAILEEAIVEEDKTNRRESNKFLAIRSDLGEQRTRGRARPVLEASSANKIDIQICFANKLE